MSEFEFRHTSVMPEEVLRFAREGVLASAAGAHPSSSPLLVDGTLGEAGHSLVLRKNFPEARLIGLDRDPSMLERARARMRAEGFDYVESPSELRPGGMLTLRSPFSGLAAALPEPANSIVLDLGVSLFHFQGAERGFSYNDEALDMRLDPALPRTARDLVNELGESELSELLRTLGEERFSGRIARAVVEARPIESARSLAEIVKRAVPAKKPGPRGPKGGAKGGARGSRGGGIHPATRVFQALRMEVNGELSELRAALATLPEKLAPGGTLIIISFHSLEDRLVKERFREIGEKAPTLARAERDRKYGPRSSDKDYLVLTPRPLTPTAEETTRNPASRSAKLRVLRRKADN